MSPWGRAKVAREDTCLWRSEFTVNWEEIWKEEKVLIGCIKRCGSSETGSRFGEFNDDYIQESQYDILMSFNHFTIAEMY